MTTFLTEAQRAELRQLLAPPKDWSSDGGSTRRDIFLLVVALRNGAEALLAERDMLEAQLAVATSERDEAMAAGNYQRCIRGLDSSTNNRQWWSAKVDAAYSALGLAAIARDTACARLAVLRGEVASPRAMGLVGCRRCGIPCAIEGDVAPPDGLCVSCRPSHDTAGLQNGGPNGR